MRLAFLLLTALLTVPSFAAPKVIVSVVPAHAIVSAVMGETGKPELLLSGKMSEHTASFSPAQISALGKADLVFIFGAGLEVKLTQMSGSEAVNGKHFVELSKAEGIATLPIREGGAWDAHDHEEEHAAAPMTPAFDPHTWLDPVNAAAMARAAARELSKTDPENAAIYAANAEAFAASLDALSAEIAADLAPVTDKPYAVFHDAYQYFESRFGLRAVGSVSDFSAASPSAKRLKEVRDKLTDSGAVCAFREPQFDDRFVSVVTEGTEARTGVLDGIGADLQPGAAAYPTLLRNMAKSLKACLGS